MARDLLALKKLVSARLTDIPGVTGVGLPQGRLTVYLAQDLPGIRQRVREIVGAEDDQEAVDFVVSGEFRAAGS